MRQRRGTNSNTHCSHFADRPWGGAWDLQPLGVLDGDHLSSTGRNPDGDVQPWCYVAETEEGIYWRYCDIPTCHSEWARLDKDGNFLGCLRRLLFWGHPTKPDSAAPSSAWIPGLLRGFGGTTRPQWPQRHLNEAHGPGVPSLLPHEGLPGTAPTSRPERHPELVLSTKSTPNPGVKP